MIVRESPSRPQHNGAWPPRSPHEALLSSPSRRKKLGDPRYRESTSPSPSKRRRLEPAIANDENDDPNALEDEDDEDDEETLQLKLQAIQARLKLKQLRKSKSLTSLIAKDRRTSSDDEIHEHKGHRIATSTKETSPRRNQDVVIPLSPTRKAQPKLEASPKRVQLGIDKGLTAPDVSLKRARSQLSSHAETRRRDVPPSKSFSERLTEVRGKDKTRLSHQERMAQGRSRGFGVTKNSDGISTEHLTRPRPDASSVKRPASADNAKSGASSVPRIPNRSRLGPTEGSEGEGEEENDDDGEDKDDSRKWNRFKYSSRTTSDRALEQEFADKTLFSIPRLLSQVVAPSYDPPNTDQDYVVYGIIAHKTTPHSHKPTHKINSDADPDEDPAKQRSKFMVLNLTDLKWQIDLFLFGTAFEQFWKLTVGTVIAILNPAIMPPKPHMRHSGNFALKLGSSEDTVLEIGHSKDLGWCKSIKKDGKKCGQWIDSRRTEFCDFHVNLAIEKTKAGRMEINSMAGIDFFGMNGKKQGRGGASARGCARGSGGRGGRGKKDNVGRYYDREAHEVAYQIPVEHQRGFKTAKMLDAEDYAQGGLSKAERSRKRLAEHQKERDLAKHLSAAGTGVGRDYMRRRHADAEREHDQDSAKVHEPALDAQSLGLVHAKNIDVKLSPVKGGKLRGDTSSAQPLGWSSAFKRGLPSPERQTSPTRSNLASQSDRPRSLAGREQTPAAKRARFMIEKKGIRHPGRESLAEDARKIRHAVDVADDDDDLDIV